MRNQLIEYHAIVLVPVKIAFRTNADGIALTDCAHEAASGCTGIEGYEPRLLEVKEAPEDPPREIQLPVG